MTSIVIRKPGICSTLQDLGRTGYRACGVPASGALDPVALMLANALIGNAPNCAGIEMLYNGVTFEVSGDAVRIALCGTEATLTSRATVRPRTLPPWESVTVHHGETVRVHTIYDTAAAYLVIEGGFEVAPVLGSVSTHLKSALGGWHGRTLRAGDVLPVQFDAPSARWERRYGHPLNLHAPTTLRVILGPHDSRFEDASIAAFLSSEYGVSTQSDRSGLRLEGEVLKHIDGYDLNSEGITAGSIQVPGTGLPVILIGDHPTVGGYPKIATVISADLAAAGRLRIGSRVRFNAITEAQATHARTNLQAMMNWTIASMSELRA
ncbi:MAG: biotin-dependent carboxyltransferase family protein [Pseudomonadota bacterium]